MPTLVLFDADVSVHYGFVFLSAGEDQPELMDAGKHPLALLRSMWNPSAYARVGGLLAVLAQVGRLAVLGGLAVAAALLAVLARVLLAVAAGLAVLTLAAVLAVGRGLAVAALVGVGLAGRVARTRPERLGPGGGRGARGALARLAGPGLLVRV